MSHQELFPRKFTACQAGFQSPDGVSCTSNPIRYSCKKFSHIVRRKVGSVFTDLRPNKFNRVEFWCADRKVIDMQAWILGNELLNELALMDGMVIPHQNDLAWNNPQQPFQKSDDLLTAQAAPIRASDQFDLAAIWADQQCAQQVQPLVVLQAGTDGRRMSSRRPAALERRNQRETAFIFKNQRGQQFTPLFLSLARPAASRKQLPPRRVGSPSAAVSGCSNPSDPSRARHHWEHIGFQTIPRSSDRSAPASSNLLYIHGHKPRVTTLAPTAGSAHPSGAWVSQPVVHFFSAGLSFVAATDRRCGW